MKIPGIKYFPYLNVKRFFLEGQEVTASAAQLNAIASPFRSGVIPLSGLNPTVVNFVGANAVAEYAGAAAEPFNLAGGLTIIVNADGAGAETITVPDTSGTWVGDTTGRGDLTGFIDNNFYINVNGLGPQLVTLDLAAPCDTGANTATEMQAKIRALVGGIAPYSGVTVGFVQDAAGPPQTGTYTITAAGTTGTGSSIVITPGTADISNELAIEAASATPTAGTGAGANNTAVTIAELVAWINATAATFTADESPATRLSVYGLVVGGSLAIGNGTANAAIGFTNGHTRAGTVGLGYLTGMANVNYQVYATAQHDVAGEIAAIAVTNKTVNGFSLVSGVATRTYDVDLIIVGEPA